MDSGRLTLRLALPASCYWTFVPLVEIVALFLASPAARRIRPWQQTIDLFFTGHAPWLLWLIAFSAYWAFLPTMAAASWPPRFSVWYFSAGIVAGVSACVDFRFFRLVLQCTPWQAARLLLLQRILAWGGGLAIFLGSSGYQVLATRFGW